MVNLETLFLTVGEKMSWNSQGGSGGPWGSGGSDNGNRRPPNGPDIEDLLKKSQENLKRAMPGGGSKGFILLVILGVIGLWLSTGFYRVSEGEKGVELRFGKAFNVTEPGLHFHLPSPIESHIVTKVSTLNVVESGVQLKSARALQGGDTENLMLTGDENIIKVRFTVQWSIKDVKQFNFNDPNPSRTVKLAAESAVREVLARTTLAEALTTGKEEIIRDSKKLLQSMLDEYQVGIEIHKINLESVNPPDQVIDAFRDVQRAKADMESKVNQAKAYSNSILPVARGEAQELIKTAEAYKEAVVKNAEGDSARFMAVLREYKSAPEATLIRLSVENSEKVLKNSKKIVFGEKGVQGVLPYLPLPSVSNQSRSQNTNEGVAR